MHRIAVLIPCYNEETTIGKVVADAKTALPDAAVYVYDNNSTDRTVQAARQAGAIVRRESMQGKGNVVRRMFREIDADCYIITDGDNTYSMEHAPQMVQSILDGTDMVVGDRLTSTYFSENKRKFHNFGNSIVRSTINRLFDSDIKDIMTGYRAFSYDFVKTFPVLSKGFEIETEMTIHAVYNNMNIENIVVDYRDRQAGSVSKLNTFSDGFRVLRTILRLYRQYRPFSFFGLLALLLTILSAVFFFPVLFDYFRTGLVARFPTLIVCGFMMLAAIISLFSGMILENSANNYRRTFEILRNIIHDRGKNHDSI